MNTSDSDAHMRQLMNNFGYVDYGVFLLLLVVSGAIGAYYAIWGKQKTAADFLLGNRSLGVFPVALSLFSSFVSAIALLGFPAEVYQYGLQVWAGVLTLPIVMFVTSYFFIPVFYELGLTSSYEYLEMRFGRPCRILASLLFVAYMLFYMSVVLYAPALALSQVTGLSIWFSVVSTGIVCTFYTTIGGLKAVVWTDVFQSLVMILTCFVVLVKGVSDAGGFGKVWQINSLSQRTEIFDMDLNPLARLTFWTISIGETLKWISTYGFNQAMVQRYLAVPSLKQAQRTVWVVLPFKVLILTLTCGGGLIAYAKYHDCDPIVTKQVKAADQIYPLFVMQSLSFIPGFTGLFVAGVFSGSLSTISSGVNSLAAVTLEDFVKTFWTKKLSDKREAFITKALAVFYGVASLGFVFIAKDMGNILPAVMKVGGLLSPPIGALFMLGMFFPQANSKGAFVGTVCGLAVNLWIGIGSILYKPYYAKKPISVEGCIDLFESATGSTYNETTFVNYYSSPAKMALDEEVLDVYKLSFMYYAVTGTLIPIIVGLIVSKLTNSKEDLEVDIRLFSPPIRKFITASRETQPKNVKLVHVLSNNNLKGNTVAEAET